MRVKICGITTPEDAIQAAGAGADAVGLNFVGGPRQIHPLAAHEILAVLPTFVTPVALVHTGDGASLAADICTGATLRRVSHLQLYGQVTGDVVRQLLGEGYKPMIVSAVRDRDFARPVTALLDACGGAAPAAVVLDAFAPDRLGGSGRVVHWPWIAQAREAGELDGWPPIVLAGGLRPDNVAQAIAQVHPWAVDVASGVETQDHRKDAAKMNEFVRAARAAAG